MKKFTAILFISTLILMQYSKQFAYLSCKLENINATTKCDCEKQLNKSASNNQSNELPAEKHNHQSIVDEFFIATNNTISTISFFIINKPAAYYQSSFSQTYVTSDLRPPIQG